MPVVVSFALGKSVHVDLVRLAATPRGFVVPLKLWVRSGTYYLGVVRYRDEVVRESEFAGIFNFWLVDSYLIGKPRFGKLTYFVDGVNLLCR